MHPKLSAGGFLIVDDYGALLNCRLAVEDFRTAQGITDPIVTVDWTGGLLAEGRGDRRVIGDRACYTLAQ